MPTARVIYLGTAPAMDARACQAFTPNEMDDLERALIIAADHADSTLAASVVRIQKKVSEVRRG